MCPQSINVSLAGFLLRPPTWCQGVYPVHTAHNMKQGSWWWFYMCGKFLLHLCVNGDQWWVMIVGENGKTKHKILYHLPQSVRWSVTNTFRFPICWCLWTVTERMWTMRRDIFFESYDQDISTWPKNTYLPTHLPSLASYLPTHLPPLENTLKEPDPRDLCLFRNLIRVLRQHDVTKKTYQHNNLPTYIPASLRKHFSKLFLSKCTRLKRIF